MLVAVWGSKWINAWLQEKVSPVCARGFAKESIMMSIVKRDEFVYKCGHLQLTSVQPPPSVVMSTDLFGVSEKREHESGWLELGSEKEINLLSPTAVDPNSNCFLVNPVCPVGAARVWFVSVFCHNNFWTNEAMDTTWWLYFIDMHSAQWGLILAFRMALHESAGLPWVPKVIVANQKQITLNTTVSLRIYLKS
jgi:hypothetical protein